MQGRIESAAALVRQLTRPPEAARSACSNRAGRRAVEGAERAWPDGPRGEQGWMGMVRFRARVGVASRGAPCRSAVATRAAAAACPPPLRTPGATCSSLRHQRSAAAETCRFGAWSRTRSSVSATKTMHRGGTRTSRRLVRPSERVSRTEAGADGRGGTHAASARQRRRGLCLLVSEARAACASQACCCLLVCCAAAPSDAARRKRALVTRPVPTPPAGAAVLSPLLRTASHGTASRTAVSMQSS